MIFYQKLSWVIYVSVNFKRYHPPGGGATWGHLTKTHALGPAFAHINRPRGGGI